MPLREKAALTTAVSARPERRFGGINGESNLKQASKQTNKQPSKQHTSEHVFWARCALDWRRPCRPLRGGCNKKASVTDTFGCFYDRLARHRPELGGWGEPSPGAHARGVSPVLGSARTRGGWCRPQRPTAACVRRPKSSSMSPARCTVTCYVWRGVPQRAYAAAYLACMRHAAQCTARLHLAMLHDCTPCAAAMPHVAIGPGPFGFSSAAVLWPLSTAGLSAAGALSDFLRWALNGAR